MTITKSYPLFLGGYLAQLLNRADNSITYPINVQVILGGTNLYSYKIKNADANLKAQIAAGFIYSVLEKGSQNQDTVLKFKPLGVKSDTIFPRSKTMNTMGFLSQHAWDWT